MKTALVVLVLVTAVSHRAAFVVFGQPVLVPWLIAAAEILAAAAGVRVAVRVIGPFRSWHCPQAAYGVGGESW